ncbi:MAG TPA: nucleoside hydrolase [Chthoniobacterales bacterium]|nr:nucleoside hydrolase [Chthoniobacterales bacterium]
MAARWWIDLCALFLALAASKASLAAKSVWIDTDVSIGSPIREVDDAFALILAFHSPEVRIAGISTSYGNASLSDVDRIAREMVERFGGAAGLTGHDVYPGAKSARDINESAARSALAAALRKQRLTYIALGPLTNLAATLQLHPQLRGRLDQIIFVGGVSSRAELGFGAGNWLQIHDANVWKDAAAVDVVLRSGLPLLLIPVAAGRTLTLNEADLRQLSSGGPAAQYLSRRIKSWSWFWRSVVGLDGGPVFDALAAITAVNSKAVCQETRFAEVDRDQSLIVTRSRGLSTRRVHICTCVKPETKSWLMRRLLAP